MLRRGGRRRRSGSGKRDMETKEKAAMQEEARALVGVDFLGQTHKPKGAFEKTS